MRSRAVFHVGLCLSVAFAAHAEWVPQQNPALPTTSFRGVQALNAKVVWAAGTNGTCLRTLDGGGTWELKAVRGAEGLDFRGIAAFDAYTAVLVSTGDAPEGKARIYRTEDGGKTWQLVFDTRDQGVFLDGMAFWDKRHGLVYGDSVDGKWYLLQSADGGRTWQRVPPEGLPPMLPGEGAFAASNSSLVLRGEKTAWLASGAAERSRVFHSTDRGQTWQVAETPMPAGTNAGIFSMRFWDDTHGIAVGGDHKQVQLVSQNVILTADGGHSWQLSAPTEPPGLKEAVVVVSNETLLATGPSGTSVSHDLARSWQKVDLQSFHGASCAQGQCWAVGSKGTIAKWK
jgi:photosystem II stability/assembly factor-like uncharacterized protein